MSKNCLRHMATTVEILEPTLIIVQGVKVAPDLGPIVTTREHINPQLQLVTISGVDAALVSFTHPSAKSLDKHWGRLTSADYLRDTVVPTMTMTRERLGLA